MVWGKSKENFPPVKVNYGQHVFGKDRATYLLNLFFLYTYTKKKKFCFLQVDLIDLQARNRVFLMSLYPQVNSEDKSVCTKAQKGFLLF